MRKIHPYVALFYNLFVPVFLMLNGAGASDIFFILFSASALIISRKYKRLIKSIIYSAVFYGLYLLTFQTNSDTLKFLGLMFSITARLIPCIIMSTILVVDYTSADLLTCLEKLKLPKRFIIALTITIRYFPIFKREFTQIKDSMRLRGIKFTLLKPIKSFSYFIVPQLFRCMLLAEELTGAGLTKGIENKCKRSFYTNITFQAFDALLIMILVLGSTGVKLWLMH